MLSTGNLQHRQPVQRITSALADCQAGIREPGIIALLALGSCVLAAWPRHLMIIGSSSASAAAAAGSPERAAAEVVLGALLHARRALLDACGAALQPGVGLAGLTERQLSKFAKHLRKALPHRKAWGESGQHGAAVGGMRLGDASWQGWRMSRVCRWRTLGRQQRQWREQQRQ